ncbi:MAG: portal protein [Phycisphaerales bacterium]|nr:MAG: portal protein [Phycisphaerales bacterium]
MGEIGFIRDIGVMIVSAAVLVLLARLIKMPSIVAYILAGLVIGPVLGMLTLTTYDPDVPDRALDVITGLGIVLLMFLVGLELSFDKIRDVGKVAVLLGIAQIAFIGVGSIAAALALGFAFIPAMFIATALTNSSTVLVVKLLEQKRETSLTYAHIVIGLNLIKDVALIIVLTLLGGLGMVGSDELGGVALQLLGSMLGLGLLVVVAGLCARFLLARAFHWAMNAPRLLFVWSLTWCFMLAVAADKLGLSPAIGAFLAGISLAQLSMANDIRRRVHPLMNFFLAIFFVAIGAQMELGATLSLWPSVLVFGAFIVIVVPIFTAWLTARMGYGHRSSFMVGSSMGQISELSFVFAAVGVMSQLIEIEVLSLITMLGLLTIAISSYVIMYNGWIYEALQKRGWLRWLKGGAESDRVEPGLKGHIVVVGMNPLGQKIARDLHKRGETVLAIDTDQRKLAGLPCRTMVGHVDTLSVLEEAFLPDAKFAITALKIEETNNLFVYRCKQFGVPVAAHAFDGSVARELRRLGADLLIESRTQAYRQIRERLDDALAMANLRPAPAGPAKLTGDGAS